MAQHRGAGETETSSILCCHSAVMLCVQFCLIMMDSTLTEDRTMVAARRALVLSPIRSINILLPAV